MQRGVKKDVSAQVPLPPDPDLSVPAAAPLGGDPLPIDASPLVVRHDGSDARIAVGSAALHADARAGGGPLRVSFGMRAGWCSVEASTEAGPLRNGRARQTPLGISREYEIAGARIQEAFAPAPPANCLIGEWTHHGGDPPAWLHLDCVVHDAGPVSWRGERGVLQLRSSIRPITLFVSDAAAVWSVSADNGGDAVRCHVAVPLPPGGFVRLAVVAGTGSEIDRAARALREPGLAVRARAGRLARLAADRLAVDGSDSELGRAVEWAKAWLETTPSNGADVLRCARAALCSGEREYARRAIETYGEPDAAGADLDLLYLRLFADLAAWAGGPSFTREHWPRLVAVLSRLAGHPEFAISGDLAEALVRAAELAGKPPPASLLAAARGERSRSRSTRAAATQEGAGCEPSGYAVPDGPVAAARLIHSVSDTLLGIEADAPRHRLVMRPRVPAGWDRLSVKQLRVGDAAVTMDCRRDGVVWRVALEQTGGAVPVRLIFEPMLVGTALIRSEVDGRAAVLDARTEGGALHVPVQLSLDAPRRVLLEVAA